MSSQRPTPPWPSLYDFLIEIKHIENRDPVQPNGRYLHDPTDVFRFTLYWTLVFYTPAFFFCGLYAFLNLTFTPHSRVRRFLLLAPSTAREGDVPLKAYKRSPSPVESEEPDAPAARPRPNERRSRLAFAILVAFTFALVAVGGAVVGAAVMGYVMAGLFKAARYNMSTWIPFLMGLIQTLIGFLGLWPTVVDII